MAYGVTKNANYVNLDDGTDKRIKMIVQCEDVSIDIGGPIGFLPEDKPSGIEVLYSRALNLKINAFDNYMKNPTAATQDQFLRLKRYCDYIKKKL